MKTETPRPILLADYTPPAYLIDTVALDIALAPAKTKVKSKLAVRPNPAAGGKGLPLVLDGEHLSLEKVAINGKALDAKDYALTDQSLTIKDVPQKPFKLAITTTCNPKANQALTGLYLSKGIYCTQCEAQGFRRITYFPDRPDVLSRYTVRIEAKATEAPVLLSNGNLIEQSASADGKKQFAVWDDPHPKPSYLFALVGGALAPVKDTFKTASGRKVDLIIYVEPGKENRCAWAMDSLKRAMAWDETRYGLEYDLDLFMIVAISDFNMGAMENKGLNVFNDKLILANPETATDADYMRIESVVAHEYFHNWTGNRITCRDWFQLCLKEGLTVFRDQEFSADQRSAAVQRIQDVRMLRARQFAEDAGPLAHPVRPDRYLEINNFYTATVYEKGAELCRMLQTMLGREGFRKGMDLYVQRCDGTAATVEDFVGAMADASGRDLKAFMTWYAQAGTPKVTVEHEYNPRKETASLTFSQTTSPTPGQPNKSAQTLPIVLGLIGPDGQDYPLTLEDHGALAEPVVIMTEAEQTFRFTGVPNKPVLSLFRGFSAPVDIHHAATDKELEFLIGHDSDPLNRWQAAQSLATRLMLGQATALAAGHKPAPAGRLAKALTATLTDENLEPAFRAEILRLPGELDLAREIGRDVDPDIVHQVAQGLRASLGKALREPLTALYERHTVKGAYKPDAEQSGRRALRNTAMALLAATKGKEDLARAVAHYHAAKNMTDQMAALGILAHVNTAEKKAIYKAFYDRFAEDHLVIDKWFALQATAHGSRTLDAVMKLKKHKKFSMKTPNKVRALIGSFASANPAQFNRADGAGYQFVMDAIRELDTFNPQIAARMLTAFESYRKLEPTRRGLAEAQLKALAKHKPLSRDVYDMVNRLLG